MTRKVVKKDPAARLGKQKPARLEELARMMPTDPARIAASQIRRAAFLRYVTEPDLTVEELLKLEPFASTCSLASLHRWSVVDGWTKGRKQQFEQIKASIMKHMATRQVQNHLETLGQIKSIKDRLVTELATADISQMAADKLVKSLCLVVDTELKLLGLTAGVLTPAQQQPAGVMDGADQSSLSDAEARTVALALMRHRREASEATAPPPAAGAKPPQPG